MGKSGEGMYTDEQWLWLYDRRCEGYSVAELTRFARCHKQTIDYHWRRLGLRLGKADRPALNRKKFEMLGRKGNG